MRQTHRDKATNEDERRYWLWVTRPEYYLEEDGTDRKDLDPESGVASDGWWTCHKDTQKGDLIFLWRTDPKQDIGYLIQAKSDAYSIVDDDYASEMGWDYGCDYQVLYKFKNPVTIKDIKDSNKSPYLQDWGAYRAHFRRRVHKIPLEHWRRLNQLASDKNPGYREFIDSIEKETVSKSILLEEQLEEALVRDLSLLQPFGYDLKLCARQLVCKGNGGRIDLLCYDNTRKRYVVIELKNVRAGQNTFGQIANYVGWVQKRIATKDDNPVIGLVISRGYDAKFQSSLSVTDRISHLDIEQLGFK